ncbi:trypsin-like peptidase domain-containing protein [Winogradskyella litoriviva]|uniref:Trypsin-like peptidase domain-containing protein n=1 Tax=Winogradskyella litoriviva TaxID=1220182 RepID=A0ABX2E1F6_9FLAO|nr:trypsin-like peptidase domain-containing protein [Winogradskyella litoriviva]NRD21893.1 trypsin-like peptidase domain-containing protein [Winogradskyella litoriviva]
MRKYGLIIFIFLLFTFSCNNKPQITNAEPWINKPVSQWPDFALTNTISFTDTTYTDFANSFLINTGIDTVAVSCKHLFMVFEKQLGMSNIDLGPEFKYWNLYPKNKKEKTVSIKRLINKNQSENIGEFNTLKIRDWIIFEIEDANSELYPLKIRFTPVKKNEVVYAVGWGIKQKDNSKPALIKLQCFDNLGDYFYTKHLKTDTQPHGRSGSPVIDKNGYLVGIVSGQEGNLGVIGSVNYLKKILKKYNIEYVKPSH